MPDKWPHTFMWELLQSGKIGWGGLQHCTTVLVVQETKKKLTVFFIAIDFIDILVLTYLLNLDVPDTPISALCEHLNQEEFC